MLKKESFELFDNGWLASRWYINGFLDLGRWTNFKPIVGDIFGPMSKIAFSQRHFSTLGNFIAKQNANVGPTNDCCLGDTRIDDY